MLFIVYLGLLLNYKAKCNTKNGKHLELFIITYHKRMFLLGTYYNTFSLAVCIVCMFKYLNLRYRYKVAQYFFLEKKKCNYNVENVENIQQPTGSKERGPLVHR